jgi:hypothetical protein
MIHYRVSFGLRDGVTESDQLKRIEAFLTDLKDQDQIVGFTLLRNRSAHPTTKRPQFQATVLFAGEARFGIPFAAVTATGIHAGKHGLMIEHVTDMSVEIFDEI